jgi:hypothetical protein
VAARHHRPRTKAQKRAEAEAAAAVPSSSRRYRLCVAALRSSFPGDPSVASYVLTKQAAGALLAFAQTAARAADGEGVDPAELIAASAASAKLLAALGARSKAREVGR